MEQTFPDSQPVKLLDVFKSMTDVSVETEAKEPKSQPMDAASAAMDRAIEERRRVMGDRRQDTASGPSPGTPERRSGLERRDGPEDRRTAAEERRQMESALLNDGIAERRFSPERRTAPPPAFGKRGSTP